jgi:uncharacterized protein with PIN domain
MTTADNLIIFIENESDFYSDWLKIAENALPYFFKVSPFGNNGSPEICYENKLNSLSFSVAENVRSRMSNAVRKFSKKARSEGIKTQHEDELAALEYFTDKMETQIKNGEMTLPYSVSSVLTSLYLNNKCNISATARELDTTRYQVDKIRDIMSEDAFRRYSQVQSGKAYDIVMGDCFPFVNNLPRFTPILFVERDDENTQINAGDLVANRGSNRFYEVSELGARNSIIYTVKGMPLLHKPCRVLPKKYRNSAAKFCGTVNGNTPKEFISNTD